MPLPQAIGTRAAEKSIRRGPLGLVLAVMVLVLATMAGVPMPGAVGRGHGELPGIETGVGGDRQALASGKHRSDLSSRRQWQPLAGAGSPEKERSQAALPVLALAAAAAAVVRGRGAARFGAAIAAASGSLTVWSPTGPPLATSR